ncbi:hypothetical protein K1X22_21795 [Mycolicibacterium farcinogenes]|uniref:hypothetical protein n=1 Tax=Mycolicibacterium farcinogenes TaxID=1802 RepID=UPI001C8E5962|nr:hypothetical protein [Mycolicibacterium farcinogenes]QZH58863.1 hypothetical protein K1X22_21795 [Mycolicibacterium farcinogenes]
MPLRDVLRNIEDHPPKTARLVENITQIMAAEQPDSDLPYSVDEVLTAVVYAMHDLEQEVIELREHVRLQEQLREK